MKKELNGILFLFLIVFISVSLLSYHNLDPSVGNHPFSLPDDVHNLFGIIGAHVAGFFVFLFGLGAFWIPVLLALAAAWYLKGRSGRIIGLTGVGGLLLMISTGCLFYLFKDAYQVFGSSFSAGGVISAFLTSLLLRYANIAGAIIIMVFFFVIGFILATGISTITIYAGIRQVFQKTAVTVRQDMAEFKKILGEQIEAAKQRRAAAKKQIDVTPVMAQEQEQEKVPELIEYRDEPEPEVLPGPEPLAKKAESRTEPSIVELEEDDFEFEPKIGDIREKSDFELPVLSFLDEPQKIKHSVDSAKLKDKSRILEQKLNDFNISGEVVEILPGPVITTFEYRPAPGVKISKIVGLTDDLALALSAISIRIVAPIPGKDVVGIEIPNDARQIVHLKELIASRQFAESHSRLTLALGKDILGSPVVTKMDSMPHLLIAGATGTGKSVGLNAMIISLLYKSRPDEIKLIMIDPKRIELSVYNDIPHLISPVVTDMKKATNALFWAVREMERRYELLAESGVRNIVQFNELVELQKKNQLKLESEEEEDLEKLPYIVIIVDEFADLMMVASRDVESALARLAQMARAAGIHLILATQRPSVDVLTGTIKANFPTRISFQVSSKIDSRTILDSNGSENLLGNGDMLFMPPGTGRLMRIQGAFISEKEIAKVTAFLKKQQKPDYVSDVTKKTEDSGSGSVDESEYDEKYDEAVALVTKTRQASISSVQRHLRIGYNRAARIIEMMEKEGIVGPADGSKPREILVRAYDDEME